MINMTEETLANRVMKVLKDFHKTPEERREFVNTLTEKEMRSIFIDLCEVWAYKSNIK